MGCVWNVKPEDRLCKLCRVWKCADRPVGNRNRYANPVYPRLRSMEVGEVEFFELNDWERVRTSASRLKSSFGAVYEVSKVEGDIKVIRIS